MSILHTSYLYIIFTLLATISGSPRAGLTPVASWEHLQGGSGNGSAGAVPTGEDGWSTGVLATYPSPRPARSGSPQLFFKAPSQAICTSREAKVPAQGKEYVSFFLSFTLVLLSALFLLSFTMYLPWLRPLASGKLWLSFGE